MPTRLLFHGSAPSCTGVALEPGCFETDVARQGQLLIDLEFLSRYALANFVCVYAKEPAYMDALAGLFPWLHFHAYAARQDYDPEQPAMRAPVTAETRGNVTRWGQALTKEAARVYGVRERAQSLVLVCHGLGLDEQLILHALSLAQASLLDLPSVPESYIEGELLLPLHLRGGRFLAHLVAKMYGRATTYDPRVMREELGFAQAVLRATDAYDQECHEVIVASYGKRFACVTGYGELVAEGMARLAVRDAAVSGAGGGI